MTVGQADGRAGTCLGSAEVKFDEIKFGRKVLAMREVRVL